MDIYSSLKTCSKCKIEKPLSNFSKDKQKKDGYYSKCKSCKKEQIQKYYQDNKETLNLNKKIWRANNPDKAKKYYQDNKETLRAKQKEYNKNNKERIREMKRNYSRKKQQTDELYALRRRISRLVLHSITKKGYSKKSKTWEILGCSYDEFKLHIENQFLEGMNWDNRSEWHLDHITPVSWGKSEEEILILNHYTNFQPLWAIDNLKKNNKYSG